MASTHEPPDAHATAPRRVRQLQKYYQKLPKELVGEDEYVLDLRGGYPPATGWHADKLKLSPSSPLHAQTLQAAWKEFMIAGEDLKLPEELMSCGDKLVYEHDSVPGLKIIRSLLPTALQQTLLSRLLRDLSCPSHKTNLHLHYSLPPLAPSTSLFTLPPTTLLPPHNPTIHKPLPLHTALSKKLRWLTLGGQYDWTHKIYPSTPPIPFPPDIQKLIGAVFGIKAEAAIFNVYNAGDTLSCHRDVSEESDADLVSVSVGCDAVFLISVAEEEEGEKGADDVTTAAETVERDRGKDGGKKRKKKKSTPDLPPHPGRDPQTLVIRLRSGDAVVMGGKSRWAWHGVPKVLDEGCPEEIQAWSPSGNEEWKGWMVGKRVNLNVRQMYS